MSGPDNTALIEEAREWAKDAARVGRSVMRDLDKGILYARRLSDALEAALAAAGVAPQPEPEYEYRCKLTQIHPDVVHEYVPVDEEHHCSGTKERRATLQQTVHLIKAGAWEPAPNQDGEK